MSVYIMAQMLAPEAHASAENIESIREVLSLLYDCSCTKSKELLSCSHPKELFCELIHAFLSSERSSGHQYCYTERSEPASLRCSDF